MGIFDFFKKNNSGPIQYSDKLDSDLSDIVVGSNATLLEADIENSEFYMKVEDVFSIIRRGVVVTGTIEKGQVAVNDNAKIMRQDGTIKNVTVTGIEMFRKMLDVAVEGDNVGLLISGVERNEISKGDIICK